MPLENPNPIVYDVARIEREMRTDLDENERDEFDSLEVFGKCNIYHGNQFIPK